MFSVQQEDADLKVRVYESVVELVEGNITKQDTEAVVNAANKRLAPGGGATHKAAGPCGVDSGLEERSYVLRHRLVCDKTSIR